MMPKLARKLTKFVYFICVMHLVARSLGSQENYIKPELAKKIAEIISGDVNAESLYDAYFYIDFIAVISITIVLYMITMMLIRKIRRK